LKKSTADPNTSCASLDGPILGGKNSPGISSTKITYSAPSPRPRTRAAASWNRRRFGERSATSVDDLYIERMSRASSTVRISPAEDNVLAARSAASAVTKPALAAPSHPRLMA
jgi:hypothetical protein